MNVKFSIEEAAALIENLSKRILIVRQKPEVLAGRCVSTLIEKIKKGNEAVFERIFKKSDIIDISANPIEMEIR